MRLPDRYRQQRLQTLVENQTTYTLREAEMSIFETHQQAAEVMLRFDQPVLASMIEGKKVMHLRDKSSFVFLPGESVMLPAGETMCIDFPEARMDRPTKCLALAIDEQKIQTTIDLMNETRPKCDNQLWVRGDFNFHFAHDQILHQLVQRMIFLCTENHPAKDFFISNTIDELLIRIAEAESRHHYLAKDSTQDSDRIRHIVDYIRDRLHHRLTVTDLSKEAYMSESHFHRSFKNQIGMSPIEFINQERLHMAAALLTEGGHRLTDISMRCGFNSSSYFSKMFKRYYGVSPLKWDGAQGAA